MCLLKDVAAGDLYILGFVAQRHVAGLMISGFSPHCFPELADQRCALNCAGLRSAPPTLCPGT
jgi:hypothetical protein